MVETKIAPASKRKNLKRQNSIQLSLILFIIVLLNVISGFVFTRFDLTSEKRFTLSPSTKEILKNLTDLVYVKIYLSGDFPPGFTRLENATKEMLDEMRNYSKGNLEYQFIDPSANPDQNQRNDLYKQLYSKGLQPTTLESKSKESASQQVIFPGAIFNYHSQEIAAQFLKDQIGAPPEQMLNNSIQGLEYEIINTIRKITVQVPPQIAFIEGHGELKKNYVEDFSNTLREFYPVEYRKINGKLDALDNYQAIIIAKPDSAFDEKDKFIIDQFIMKGGKVLWLIDQLVAEMDSLANADEIIAYARDLNLDDMLFRYGVRINYDLVQDLLAAPIPVVTGNVGNKPQQKLLPWFYFPLVIPESKHPIVNNINAVRFQFAASMDTIAAPGVKKTILLTSSQYSKTQNAPARVSLELMRKKPDVRQYNSPNKTLAVLLEGKFTSNYTNRIPPLIAENKKIGFKESSVFTKMAILSDGDLIRNDYRAATGQAMPLGFDRYTGEYYGNKNFLLNLMDYLCDDSGLIGIRAKELKLRILDKTKLESSKTMWQAIVTVGPLLILLIFGITKFYLRKRKFA